jgi:hypothetical protein
MSKFAHASFVRAPDGKPWLVVMIRHIEGRSPRYICFYNGVRQTFEEHELKPTIWRKPKLNAGR